MPGEPPHTQEEIERWADRRRPHEREAVPVPGERLLFREHDFGTPVPAVVADVQDMTAPGDHWIPGTGTGPPDENVWYPELNEWDVPTGRWLMKQDPWPWVAVRVVTTAPDGSEFLTAPRWTRESRVRGSAGWLRPGSRAHHGRFNESGE